MKTETRSGRIFRIFKTGFNVFKDKPMNLKTIVRFLALVPLMALAVERSPLSEIQALHSYTNFGNADVVFVLQSTSGTCKGYWFNKDDAGYQSNMSMLLAAYQANTKLQVHGHEEIQSKWTGADNHFCRLYSVSYSR
jgi:hypothetical protein